MEYSFESGENFLEVAKLEYQNEFDRTKVIDSKIAIALPIIATYFFFSVQLSNVKELISAPITSNTLIGATVEVCIPFSYIAALVCAFISLLFMFRSISTHLYQTVDPKQFNTAEQMSLPKKEFSAAFATIYIKALEANRLENDKRVQNYKRGWFLSLISLTCFVIHMVLKN